MRAVLERNVKETAWKEAAVSASNLSDLELTLGEVAGAAKDAEQSVTYADRSGDAFQRMSKRTTHADALHQAGRRAEAAARFREAEEMQAERQLDYPRLYGMAGFRYCDLLLAEAERAAWQVVLGSARAPRAVVGAPADHLFGKSDDPDSEPRPDQPAGARVGAREGACAPLIAACGAVE
jgi:ATP/maltotriose-dependent transcriptional regulator MalT